MSSSGKKLTAREIQLLKQAQLAFNKVQSLNKDTQYTEYLYSLIETLKCLATIGRRESREFKKCTVWLTCELEQPVNTFIARFRNIKSPDFDISVIVNQTRKNVFDKIGEFELPATHPEIKKKLRSFIKNKARLHGQILDKIREIEKKPKPFSLDRPLPNQEDNGVTLKDFVRDTRLPNNWENTSEYPEIIEFMREFMEYIKHDRDNRLRECCHADYPQLNAHQLCIFNFIHEPPLTVVEIANRLRIKGKKPRNIIDYFLKEKWTKK